MKIKNNMLILEMKNCSSCNKGALPSKIKCDVCNGTGNGPRGGKKGCRNCHGFGDAWDHVNTLVCNKCDGEYVNAELETPYNFMHLYQDDIAIKVVRDYQERAMSFEESYLGAGLFSCTDYGRHKNQADDELIESAFHFESTGFHSTQGIKLIKDKNNLSICNYLAIVTADQGYSVIPIFEEA